MEDRGLKMQAAGCERILPTIPSPPGYDAATASKDGAGEGVDGGIFFGWIRLD